MNSVWEWLLTVGAGAAGSAALLGVAGYLFRSQLSHWLNKDLEAVKARHQRDLETYKVSLIAEAERAKATQDVQKALALKMAERKFEAIDHLYKSFAPLATEIFASLSIYCTESYDLRKKRSEALRESLVCTSSAVTLAAPFLSIDDRVAFRGLIAEWIRAIGALNDVSCSLTEADVNALDDRLSDQYLACKRALEGYLDRMLTMT